MEEEQPLWLKCPAALVLCAEASLCSPGRPGTHCMGQAGLKHTLKIGLPLPPTMTCLK